MSGWKRDPVRIAELLKRDDEALATFERYGAWPGADMECEPELYHEIQGALRGERSNGARPRMEGDGATAVPASEIKRERVEYLVPGRVPVGMTTLIVGDPGEGKSLWTCSIAAELSRRGEVVLMVTAEDALGATVRPRLEAAEADLQNVRFVRMRRHGLEDGIVLPDDVQELDRLIREHDARLAVIDPLMAHLAEPVNSWRDQSVRRALAPLHRMAEDTGCANCIVLHLNKGGGDKAIYRIGGSIGIPGAARSALLLARDPDDAEDGPRRVLAHIKCNVGPEAESLLYEVKPTLIPASDSEPEVETARLELIGESAHLSPHLLNGRSADERLDVDVAAEFLQDALADGEWHPSKAIKESARPVGIALRTLQRAREKIGAEHDRQGFPAVSMWRLPVAPSDPGKAGTTTTGTTTDPRSTSGESEGADSQSRHLNEMTQPDDLRTRCSAELERLQEMSR
jgi:hypothetical protein